MLPVEMVVLDFTQLFQDQILHMLAAAVEVHTYHLHHQDSVVLVVEEMVVVLQVLVEHQQQVPQTLVVVVAG